MLMEHSGDVAKPQIQGAFWRGGHLILGQVRGSRCAVAKGHFLKGTIEAFLFLPRTPGSYLRVGNTSPLIIIPSCSPGSMKMEKNKRSFDLSKEQCGCIVCQTKS